MLGDNIKLLRKNKGLTQEELAIRLNVVRQTVSKWEKGFSVPDAEMLQKMAEVLDVDIKQLLGVFIILNILAVVLSFAAFSAYESNTTIETEFIKEDMNNEEIMVEP